MDELIDIEIPQKSSSIIKVIGVGGGGSNAVNYMYNLGIKDVDFVVCNTDVKALVNSPISNKIQLGITLTEGLGAGNDPQKGRDAAVENILDVSRILEDNTKMVFITAGMGGGTGTGAAPIIALKAKEMGLLTVGIVTLPLLKEGRKRVNQAIEGILEMEKNVDSLLIINNEKLREMYGDLALSKAFAKADNVLATAAKGIAEIITVHGYINVDFADVKTVMKDSGVAVMGSGTSVGDFRAIDAVQAAMESPLLNNNRIEGAKNILVNITSGNKEVTLDELGEITDYLQDTVGNSANLIWGTSNDANLNEELTVTLIATGFSTENVMPQNIDEPINNRKRYVIDMDGNVIEADSERFVPETNSGSENYSQSADEKPRRVMTFENVSSESDHHINVLYGKTERTKTAKQYENYADVATDTIGYAVEPIKSINPKELRNEKILEKIENEPAYKRRGMSLGNETASQATAQNNPFAHHENRISHFTVSNDGSGPVIRKENSFLHCPVD